MDDFESAGTGQMTLTKLSPYVIDILTRKVARASTARQFLYDRRLCNNGFWLHKQVQRLPAAASALK